MEFTSSDLGPAGGVSNFGVTRSLLPTAGDPELNSSLVSPAPEPASAAFPELVLSCMLRCRKDVGHGLSFRV